MALRSLIRKGPALAGALRSPAAHAPSPALRPRSPTFQALQPAAGSRFLSQGPGAAAGGQALYSEEMLREKADRVHREFQQNMKMLQQQRDEFWRGWSSRAEALSGSLAGWCSKHGARAFSTDDKITNGHGGYRQMESKPSTTMKDNDAIIDRIQKSTRGLKQGPVGHTLSSAEKRNFLINTLLDLEDSKEAVYSTLDAWIAFEQDFPLASIKQAIVALEKEEQWHRIVQVIKWMLSKGQGNTVRTYEQLVRALEKDNRAEEAHKIWEKKIAHDLHSVPWRFCGLMLAIYYRNNMLDRLIKLFHDLEACGRKCRSKEYIRKVEVAYEMLGLLEEKKDLLDKYKYLYDNPSNSDRKKGRQFKKAEKKAAEGTKQCEVETSEDLPVNTCPSDKEPVASS